MNLVTLALLNSMSWNDVLFRKKRFFPKMFILLMPISNSLKNPFRKNYHTYTCEKYLNLDRFICNHKSLMSPWSWILINDSCDQKFRGQFHQNTWTCLDPTPTLKFGDSWAYTGIFCWHYTGVIKFKALIKIFHFEGRPMPVQDAPRCTIRD